MTPDREDHFPGLLRARPAPASFSSASPNTPAALLPDHISQNIEAIKTLHIRADENLSRYQRPIETVSSLLGCPAFFYGIVGFVTVWVLLNGLSPLFAVASFDPAPYLWLQGLVGFGALLTTIIVLITQSRQGKLAEQQAQLALQVNLLAEQKIAKLIALVEELRRDLPEVTDRHDAEATAMEQSTHPHAILDALETVQVVAGPPLSPVTAPALNLPRHGSV